jgi:hypothetical protein
MLQSDKECPNLAHTDVSLRRMNTGDSSDDDSFGRSDNRCREEQPQTPKGICSYHIREGPDAGGSLGHNGTVIACEVANETCLKKQPLIFGGLWIVAYGCSCTYTSRCLAAVSSTSAHPMRLESPAFATAPANQG